MADKVAKEGVVISPEVIALLASVAAALAVAAIYIAKKAIRDDARREVVTFAFVVTMEVTITSLAVCGIIYLFLGGIGLGHYVLAYTVISTMVVCLILYRHQREKRMLDVMAMQNHLEIDELHQLVRDYGFEYVEEMIHTAAEEQISFWAAHQRERARWN